ncbi:MAG: glutamate racemase, partial [Pseudoflavonifractor sp.]
NTGATCAGAVARTLAETGALSDCGQPGLRRYFVSDSTDDFTRLASSFLGENMVGDVAQVDITQY